MSDDFTKYGVEPFMNLAEVRKVLGGSMDTIYAAIQSGELAVYSYGRKVNRKAVGRETRELRVRPQDLREYIQTLRVA